MSCTVFGGARPSVYLNIVESLHNIKTKRFLNAAKWAGPWQGMLESAAQPWTWMFLHGCITSRRKRFFNTVNKTGPCLEEHSPTISSSVFEKLHTIHIRSIFNFVKRAKPCLGEHNQPFVWTLLSVCLTSKRNDSSTTRIELGRDRGRWRARPSNQLECFYMAA